MTAFLRGAWRRRPWALIVAGAFAADVGVRLAFHFDQGRVLPIEAGILGAAGAFVLALSQRTIPLHDGPRRAECALAAALGLGALRSLLWAAGLPVWQANLIVLALAVILGFVVLEGRRPERHAPRTLRLE